MIVLITVTKGLSPMPSGEKRVVRRVVRAHGDKIRHGSPLALMQLAADNQSTCAKLLRPRNRMHKVLARVTP